MRIGLISDIHADADALKLALDQLAGHGVDQIICGGDIIGKGRQPDLAVEIIRARAIPTVVGNHDADAEAYQHMRMPPQIAKTSPLSDDALAYLKQLPGTLRFEWAGKRILLAHGTPNDCYEYAFFDNSQEFYYRMVKHADADVIILGHTHEPMRIKCKNTVIINPGSICGKIGHGSMSYGILTLPEIQLDVYGVWDGQPVWVPSIEFS